MASYSKCFLPDEVTYSSHKIAWWICSKCKNEWSTPIYSRTITKSGCSVCSESKGEKRIRRWLESQSISFTHQKTFKYLYGVGGFPLSYDFYIPIENMLIEYQGQFHDGSVSHQTKEEYSIQLEHDKRKRLYAKLNNITLLEIWYQDFKNIEFILKEALNDRQ
jgi:Probable Zinc-ribbon domain